MRFKVPKKLSKGLMLTLFPLSLDQPSGQHTTAFPGKAFEWPYKAFNRFRGLLKVVERAFKRSSKGVAEAFNKPLGGV